MKYSKKKYKINNIVLCVLIFLVLIEMIPYALTILLPQLCYGCTTIGKYQQKLNESIHLSKITWLIYLFLFIYLIYVSSYWKNPILKYGSILFSLFMIYLPTMPFIVIINIIMMCYYKNPPFIYDYHTLFPTSIDLEKNADNIIREFKDYKQTADCIRKTNPGYKIEVNSTKDNCWRAHYLKKSGVMNEEITSFPITYKLLKDPQIHNAIFSILDPGVEIPEHTGYYKGYLRYHLGIIIPDKNTEKAYIVCGGETYSWKEGEGILFDDMYLHNVKNPTNQTRVVLYLDIKRTSDSNWINTLNYIGIYLIENSIMLNIFLKNQHSQIKIEDNS